MNFAHGSCPALLVDLVKLSVNLCCTSGQNMPQYYFFQMELCSFILLWPEPELELVEPHLWPLNLKDLRISMCYALLRALGAYGYTKVLSE